MQQQVLPQQHKELTATGAVAVPGTLLRRSNSNSECRCKTVACAAHAIHFASAGNSIQRCSGAIDQIRVLVDGAAEAASARTALWTTAMLGLMVSILRAVHRAACETRSRNACGRN